MAEEQPAIREWFDQGNERGMDFMLVARDPSNDLYPYYVDSQEATTQKAIADVRDGGDRVLEVYDLKAPFPAQQGPGRAWNTEESRDASLEAGRPSYDDAVVLGAGTRTYVYHPTFTTERIDALTEAALAYENADAHELEAVQTIMRKRMANALTEEIREAHPEASEVEATVEDVDRLLIAYPIDMGRELYQAGIPSRALIEQAIGRSEIFTEAPGELHAWRERNPLSAPVPEEAAAVRAAEFDRHTLGPDGFDGYMLAPAAFVEDARRRADALAQQAPENAGEIRSEYRSAFIREGTAALAAAYPDEARMSVGTAGTDQYLISIGQGGERARALYSRGVPSAEVVASAVSRIDEQAVLRAAQASPAERVAAALERRRAAAHEDDDDQYSWEDPVDMGRERSRHHGR